MNLRQSENTVPMIRPDQLSDGPYVLLDVRLRPDYRKASGAVVRSPQEVLLSDDLPGIARDSRVAVYGDSEALVGAIVLRLCENGYREAAMLQGGFEAWRDSGMPLQVAGSNA